MHRFALAAATFALAALPAAHAASIQPAQPSAFDPVNLRMTVDSCTFVPGSVQVTAAGGTLYRTTGPAFSDPDFDPRLVLIQPAGEATLDFTAVPTTGRAAFTYDVNNIPVTASIARMVF